MQKETNFGTRVSSMIVDHFVMTMIAMLFFIPGMASMFVTAFEVSHEQTNPDIFGGLSYVGLFGFSLYFCKDSIDGRSIAKRILKIQVVDKETGQAASPLRCMVRNLLCVLWPIEVIVTLFNPSRRIGDYLAGTKVVPFDSDSTPSKLDIKQIVMSLLIAYAGFLLLMIPIEALRSSIKTNQVAYVESSLNDEAGKEIVDLYQSELADLVEADVRVYDEISLHRNLKYISVILKLKEDYLNDDDDFKEIEEKTVPLLLSLHPEGTFVGQIKYVYQEPGSMITRTKPLDWRDMNGPDILQ